MKLQQDVSNNQPYTAVRSKWHQSLCYLLTLTLAMPSLPSYAVPANNALPSGGNISSGSGTINSQGNNMTINQTSDKLAINWSSYNIGANASVTYVQPNAQAVALNRILSADPSQIFGRLQANGQVILINPNGVVVGPGAKINVGAMIVSTMNLSDSDFLSNNYRFTTPSVDMLQVALPQIVNQGTITSGAGGYVHLIGHNIQNQGSINAPGGTVGLLAGNTVALALSNNGNLIPLDVTHTKSGNALINHSGTISTANTQGVGGDIKILSDQINLLAGSTIDASGARGGGQVLIKSSLRDHTDPLYNTSKLYFDKQATINANATVTGNGGYVDTSANNIRINGAVSVLSAQGGQAGTWLLDPSNVYICSTAVGGTCAGKTDSFGQNLPATTNSYIDINSLITALSAGNNVTISTGGADSSGSVGHLYLNELLNPVMSKSATLTLIAGIDITLNANINATGCSGCGLNLILDATNGKAAGSGAIVVNSNTLNTNGGTIDFKSGTAFSNNAAQNVLTSGGNVNFAGDVLIANPRGLNIDTTNGNATAGNVVFNGRVDSANRYDFIAFTERQVTDGKTSWNDARGYALNGSSQGTNDTIGGSYLATVGSQLQNTLAGTASCNSAYGCFAGAWLGGHLNVKVNSDGSLSTNNAGQVVGTNGQVIEAGKGQWQWADGPLAGQTFYHANINTGNGAGGTQVCTNAGGCSYTAVPNTPSKICTNAAQCIYSNWDTAKGRSVAEPNGGFNRSESALQFFGSGGLWNDLNQASNPATSGDYQVRGYVQETTLAASSLNIKANSVTFSGAVGSIKPLATLTISAPTININGGLIRTTGAQTYDSGSANRAAINLGAANTELQVMAEVLPNGYPGCATVGGCLTGGKLSLNNSIIYATQDSNLTLRAFSDVTLGTNQTIDANGHALNVTLAAGDSALNQNAPQNSGGTLNLNAGSRITTNGNVTLIADSMNFSNPTTPTIVGSGTLNILTRTAAKNIYLGTAGDGLSIASSVFSGPNRAFSPSLTMINIGKPIDNGNYQQSGTVTLNNFTYGNPLTVNTSGNIVLSNTVQTTSGGALTLNNATGTNTSNISGSGSLAGGQLIVVNTDGTSTYSGTITGTGTALTKTGKGTLTLTGANTYTGATHVNQGTLVAEANAFGSNATQLTAITVAQGATFNNAPGLNATNTIGSLSGVADSNVLLNSGTLAIGGDNTNTNFAGLLSGSGNLTKIGSGTLTLSSANTYTGLTTINTGRLANGINNALLSTAIVRIADGATYDLNNFDQTLATLNDVNPNPNGAAQLQLGRGNLILGNSQDSLFSGVIAGSGNLTKTGTGNVMLSGNNIYTGTTTINSGTVIANHAYALGGASTAGVIVNNGASLLLNNLILASGTNNTSAVGAVRLNGGVLKSVGNAGLIGALNVTQSTQISNLGTSLANQVPANCNASNCSLTLNAVNIASGQTLALGNGGVWTLSTARVNAQGANLTVNTQSTYTANDTIGAKDNALASLNITANGTTLQNVTANQIQVMDESRTGVVLNGTLDASGSANGTVMVEAKRGSIRVNGDIQAGTTSGDAITLKAGSNYAAGDATGGDVVLGNNVMFKTNGTVLIYTGSIARSGAATIGFTQAANNPTYYYGKDSGFRPTAAYNIVFREQPTASLLTLIFRSRLEINSS
jgi:fibronectin-binding autotransporter adhesin